MSKFIDKLLIKITDLIVMFTMGVTGALAVLSSVPMKDYNKFNMFIMLGLSMLMVIIQVCVSEFIRKEDR